MVDAYVGNYKIIGKIAEGSIGEVFEAIDIRRKKRAAIHCLRAEVASRAEYVQRFYSQGETLSRLDHPNIARILGFIRKADTFYVVMEFVEGETLEALLRRKGRIQSTIALAFFQQTLAAVG